MQPLLQAFYRAPELQFLCYTLRVTHTDRHTDRRTEFCPSARVSVRVCNAVCITNRNCSPGALNNKAEGPAGGPAVVG
eukprot:gene10974-biopygen9614